MRLGMSLIAAALATSASWASQSSLRHHKPLTTTKATHSLSTMGWWSTTFGCAADCNTTHSCADEQLYRSVVDHLAADGYVEAGYKWLYVEDCWAHPSRDSFGRLVPDSHAFPGGLEGLTSYAHARGMRVAVSLDLGSQTCAGRPGSLGHYNLDVTTLASWSVDRVLVTTCSIANTTSSPTPLSYYALLSTFTALASAANLTSHCAVPSTTNTTLLKAVSSHCQHVQLDPRVQDDYTDVALHVEAALHQLGDAAQRPFYNTSLGPVVAGGYGLTPGQTRVQLAAWQLLKFPLLLSTDVRAARGGGSNLALNPHYVQLYAAAANSTARPPKRWTGVAGPGIDVWLSWVDEEAVAVSVFRLHNDRPHVPESFELAWDDIGLDLAVSCTVTNVWTSNVTLHQRHRIRVTIPPFDAVLLVVRPE